eukprot:GGOE01006132.1.p2 GENE.GGOE01006132.1~~GGOE01006132.1.p2  ORF type:complete len:107 (+),score=5.48 GGOE01006132.1:232-552(+)
MTGYPCGTNPFCKAYHCALPRSPICLDEHWPPPPLPALVGGTRGMRGWSSPVCKEKILTPLEFTRESPHSPRIGESAPDLCFCNDSLMCCDAGGLSSISLITVVPS